MPLFYCPHCQEIIWGRSPRLKQIWDLISEHKQVTSSFVSETLGISVQAANNQLNKLKTEGLIITDVTTHPSGGILNIWIKKQ